MKGKAIWLSVDSYAALHLIMTRFWFELRGRGFEIKLVFYLQPTAGWAVSTETFYKHLKPLHLMSELHGGEEKESVDARAR